VTFAVDGQPIATKQSSNDYEDVMVTVPPRLDRNRGAVLSMQVSNTFIPGAHDRRKLGVLVDRLVLQPQEGLVLPPRGVLVRGALAAALFGAGFGLIGITAISAVAGAVLLGLGQALPLLGGFAPYTTFAWIAARLAFWIVLAMTTGVAVVERVRRERLRNTARFVVAFSAAALFLQLLVLLHPDKPIGDALFHAHRFEDVMSGRYFFTSVAPGNYRFPYAIGLYLFAWPFASLTANHVSLLRIVAASVDASTAILLYPMVARGTADRIAGAIAVALYHCVPLSFAVLAVGNLTNAFGQSLAVGAMAAIVLAPAQNGPWWPVAMVAALTAAAFLSHTSTFAVLFGIVAVTGWLYRIGGGPLRAVGTTVLLSLAFATLFSVLAYYGHFGDVYRSQYERISSEMRAAPGLPAPPRTRWSPGIGAARTRTADIPRQLGIYFGWPILILGAVGLWKLCVGRLKNRFTLALAGWMVGCLIFLVVGILTPVDMRYYLAACPAIAMLAGIGAALEWRTRPGQRAFAAILLALAVALGVQQWLGQLG
jgi:hypothetical protein